MDELNEIHYRGVLLTLPKALFVDLAELAIFDGRPVAEYALMALDQHVNGKRAVLDEIHKMSQEAQG